MPMMPLEGVRVLELANFMAGPYCGMLLADMGADVIKVENPRGGDFSRQNPPFIEGESAGFMALNRNKRSLTINLKHPRGRELFLRLAGEADVVLENFRPGTMADLGIDAATLRSRNPRLIYCSASAYGRSGPYAQKPGFDIIAQGYSGLMSITGETDGPPVKVGVPVADLTCAIFSAYGILSALLVREKTGQGQEVETNLLESAVALAIWESSGYFATGEIPGRLGSAHRANAPYQAIETADGSITIGGQTPNNWANLCKVLGRPELMTDERFCDNVRRLANRAALIAEIEAVTKTRPSAHWLAALEAVGVPCGPINDYAAVLNDPHLNERGFIIDVEHPKAGHTRATGFPVRLTDTPTVLRRPAPVLGQHTDAVLTELGLDADEIAGLRSDGVL
jgi:crotonobetainyl-CoA:carnitine CoA-transferase CaiB-like acyl-CoA transferase